MGYHQTFVVARFSAWPQRPLPGASRGRGHLRSPGRSPRRGCTRRGRRSRRRPRGVTRSMSRTSPGKGEQSTSEGGQSALGGTARVRRAAGELSSSWGGFPEVRMQEGLPAGTGPGGRGQSREFSWPSVPTLPPPSPPHDCPLCRAAREICAAQT